LIRARTKVYHLNEVLAFVKRVMAARKRNCSDGMRRNRH